MTDVQQEVLERMPAVQASMPTTQANPYLGMIQTMIERGGDLANLDQMLDLQIKWEANEARKAFVAAMAAFKAEPMEILKKKLVSFETRDGDTTSYMHAELSDVADAVVPPMGKHGLSHRWDIQQNGGQITVTCIITHALGHSESVSITAAPDASGKKNAIQQVASTVSYLQRYTLLAGTGMATKGMDDDGRSGYDYRDQPEEPDYTDWFAKIAEAEDLIELRKVKDEMLALLANEQNKVPKPVLNAYNARVKAVTESMG